LHPSTDNNLQFHRNRANHEPDEKPEARSDDNTVIQRRTQHRARRDAESKPRAAAADGESRQHRDQTERDEPHFRRSFFRQIFSVEFC
jgi:hypothetical protein